MKIYSTPKINYDLNYRKNDLKTNVTKNNVSFGSVSDAAKGGATWIFKFIANGGFFVEFLIVDAISMIAPRILVGLNRDKEKTGKINYQAGAEEAGREIFSGPSMNLIPMGIMMLVSKALPASHMSKETLDHLTTKMGEVAKEAVDLKDKGALDKALADKLFDDAFGEFNLDNKTKLKEDFSKLLTDSAKIEKGIFNNEAFKHNSEKFEELVSLINNKNKAGSPSLNPKTIKGSSATELFEDFRNYSRDVIEKVTKLTSIEGAAKNTQEFLGKVQKSRLNVKLASAVTAFFAVGSFLLYLPKLYQQGKVSPAAASAERAKAEAAAQGGANEN